jgi:pyrimidine-nucleoside phosphorylase
MMRAVDLIRRKRDGETLSGDEIAWMVAGIARGDVADYQWAALLMAILWRGMDDTETAALTDAMMRSGRIADLSAIAGPKVDKHSTGGVGDKTSLILAPVAAAAGVRVPMVSGRGLGHTGGTLDKLESIPGFRVDLDLETYGKLLRLNGLVLIGQTPEIAPADRFLYALRDATATVESIPLIASSIMSKKLAEGIDGLVLDVKTGNGAFLERLEDAQHLAATMCAIGRKMGKRMVALLTAMDQPLGWAIGNAVEVEECLNCLRGEGPPDVTELSLELAAEMIVLAGQAPDRERALALCRDQIDSGAALERFRRMVESQGGDPRIVDDPGLLPAARDRIEISATATGFVSRLAARPIGQASMRLGAGRARVDSRVDPAVGILLHKKVGDPVERGEALCTLLANDQAGVEEARSLVMAAYEIAPTPPAPMPLILDRWDDSENRPAVME